jgi:hypothetical protein
VGLLEERMKILYICEICDSEFKDIKDAEQCESNCNVRRDNFDREHEEQYKEDLKDAEEYARYCGRCKYMKIDPFAHPELMEQGCWSCKSYDKFEEYVNE